MLEEQTPFTKRYPAFLHGKTDWILSLVLISLLGPYRLALLHGGPPCLEHSEAMSFHVNRDRNDRHHCAAS